ncbi:MAG TPA: hypothetical protein VN259_09075 [Xanthomonadales bacterium]|nr:hypothetical protein [Xanthomonadales bacterium]
MGYDIEQWRGELGLSKFKAQAALGFRNANHYNKICQMPVIPASIEIIVRLYLEYPKAPGWKKFTQQELFDLMYGDKLAAFEGRSDYTAAKVDLGNRFTRLFDRSSSRKYNWLREDTQGDREFGGAYSDVETILTILKEIPNPKEVFERVAGQVLALRGVNLDTEHRIPTPEMPPTRRKTGRKATSLRRPTAPAKAQLTAKAAKPASVKPAAKTPAKDKVAARSPTKTAKKPRVAAAPKKAKVT